MTKKKNLSAATVPVVPYYSARAFAPSDLLNEKEVATELSIAPGTLRNWRSLKVGPPWTKLRRAVRYRRADLDAFIASGMARVEAQA